MDDISVCPICNNKFRITKNVPLKTVSSLVAYTEKLCTTGMNHALQAFYNPSSKKIDLIKFSLDPKYSKFIEINFIDNKTEIHCYKNSKLSVLKIDKIISPDFPDLESLKKKVDIYILMS